MIRAKRRNVTLSSNSDDSLFHKRMSPDSPFGSQATTPADCEAVGVSSLERRKAARLHVRALNTEFARWVQSQLQDHPDELWEDGVRDYLTHTSDILDKFADVINWLKEKTASKSNVSTLINHSIEKENGSGTVSKENSVPIKSMFGMPVGSDGLTSMSNTSTSSSSISILGTSAGSSLWGFSSSASNQTLLQSSSSGLATSNPGVFNFESLPPIKTGTSSSSPASVTSSNGQTTLPMTAFSVANSTSFVLSSTSATPSFGATPKFATTTSFSAPRSAGAFTNSQPTFTAGESQNSVASNNSVKEDADEANEPEQPSSPSLKKTEEEGIVVVHETKCKLFVKSTDPADKEPWKDRGTGQLFIKCEEGAGKGTKESKPIILVRNHVGRVMLNASLYPGIKTKLQKNDIVAIFHTLDENAGDNSNEKAVARTFLIRVKGEEERNKLADVIREHAPAL